MTHALDRRALIAGASSLFLAGCADVVGPPPAPRLYTLHPALPAAQPGGTLSWALSIAEPNAMAGLNRPRIAITRPPAGLDFFADVAWSDRLPVLVQNALVEAFESGGRLAAVSRDGEGARSDIILDSDLRDFSVRYDQGEAAPLAVVRLSLRLVETGSRKVLAYKEFSAEVRSSANSVEAAVSALTEALSRVLSALVPFVLDRPPPAG